MCIFCRLVAGEIPSYRIYENENVLAFLDINPSAPGHTLVIPKVHYGRLEELPAASLVHLVEGVQLVGRRLQDKLKIEGYNLVLNNGAVAGQEVPHVHFHLIPRQPADGLTLFPAGQATQAGLEDILRQLTS